MSNLLIFKRNLAIKLRSLTKTLHHQPISPNEEQGFISSKQKFIDLDPEFKSYYDKVISCTMTSTERLYSLYTAVNYICENNIQGAFVECGVWKGGSSMLGALRLMAHGEISREIYLYDTFAGMSMPGEVDVKFNGDKAFDKWKSNEGEEINLWDYAPLEEVKQNIYSTGYPKNCIKFIKGKVELTIPQTLPGKIALLRLDTDWYESTYHELKHLYPLLVPGGIVIIDDYGHWKGARKAVDQYISENKIPIFLHRIDYTGRIAVKPF